jgi:hypothetical protein
VTRTPLALFALLLLAPAAAGQGHIPAPWDRPPGFAPGPTVGGVHWGRFPGRFHRFPRPGFTIGTGFAVGPGFGFAAGPGFGFAAPVWGPAWGGGYYNGAGVTTVVVERYVEPVPVPAAAPAAPLDPVYLSSAMARQRAAATAATVTTTTRVTLTLPAAGEVWVNGEKQPGTGTEFDLAVTTARPGESVLFAIAARWQANGQTFEYEKSLSLTAGEKKSLAVFRGTPVSK